MTSRVCTEEAESKILRPVLQENQGLNMYGSWEKQKKKSNTCFPSRRIHKSQHQQKQQIFFGCNSKVEQNLQTLKVRPSNILPSTKMVCVPIKNAFKKKIIEEKPPIKKHEMRVKSAYSTHFENSMKIKNRVLQGKQLQDNQYKKPSFHVISESIRIQSVFQRRKSQNEAQKDIRLEKIESKMKRKDPRWQASESKTKVEVKPLMIHFRH